MSFDLSNLPLETARFVSGIVSSGEYSSPDEVVVAALQLLQERRRATAEIRAQVEIGVADFDRGAYLEIRDQASHDAFFGTMKAETMKDARPTGVPT